MKPHPCSTRGFNIRKNIGGWRRCERGASAIEFAFVVPILIALYLSAVEVGNALTVYRRADQVAYTAADLVAQAKTLDGSAAKDITAAASGILTPYSTEPLSIVISSVVADDKNRPKVAWSCSKNGKARGTGSDLALPTGLTEAGTSVIVAEVKYDYVSLLQGSSDSKSSPFTITRTFYTRPRQTKSVAYTGGINCG